MTIGEGHVEVAHEALIRHWPTLRAWLDEDREGRLVHRRLTEAAQEWDATASRPGLLYRGTRLAGASEWSQARTTASSTSWSASSCAPAATRSSTSSRSREGATAG